MRSAVWCLLCVACGASPAPAPSPALAPQPPAATAPAADAAPARVRTTCPSLRPPTPASDLIGTRFDNAAAALPGGMQMLSESSLDLEFRLGAWSVVAATRGASLVVLLCRLVVLEPTTYEVAEALELGPVCPGLVLEAGTCDVDGRTDPRAFALMDEVYLCGGHGESSPARAWRVRSGRLEELNPDRVTCGSWSCEGP